MSNTNCQIDWVTNSVTMVIPMCPTGHCSHCEPHSLTPPSMTSSKPIPQIEHPTNGSETTHTQVMTNNRQQLNHPPTQRQHQIRWKWVPKNKPILPSLASPTQCQTNNLEVGT